MDALRAIVVALVLTSGVSCGERGGAPRDGGAAARDVGSADTLARPPGVACRETSDCPAPVPECGTSICMGGVCRVAPPDRDSDGHGDRACQVEDPFFLDDDCDDTDPRRFPGNPELCDDHDEDCSLTTFGNLDADGDGEVSAACCLEDEGEVLCATDCDDADPDVGFRSMEVCNGRDDDCDFEVDEGCAADAGDDGGTDVDAGGDAAAPDAGSAMDAGAGMDGGVAPMDSAVVVDIGVVDAPDAGCIPAVPSDELCNGRDDDCDGRTDEGCEIAAVYAGSHHTTALRANGTALYWGYTRGPTEMEGVVGAGSIAEGEGHRCMLTLDRHAFCRGGNEYGQLGNVTVQGFGKLDHLDRLQTGIDMQIEA